MIGSGLSKRIEKLPQLPQGGQRTNRRIPNGAVLTNNFVGHPCRYEDARIVKERNHKKFLVTAFVLVEDFNFLAIQRVTKVMNPTSFAETGFM